MKFVADPAGMRHLERSAGVRREIGRAASRVARSAVGAAPRGATGDYAQSVHVLEIAGRTYVRTNDFAGHMVEWGSVNNPPYAPIRRGVKAAGLRLEETNK